MLAIKNENAGKIYVVESIICALSEVMNMLLLVTERAFIVFFPHASALFFQHQQSSLVRCRNRKYEAKHYYPSTTPADDQKRAVACCLSFENTRSNKLTRSVVNSLMFTAFFPGDYPAQRKMSITCWRLKQELCHTRSVCSLWAGCDLFWAELGFLYVLRTGARFSAW